MSDPQPLPPLNPPSAPTLPTYLQPKQQAPLMKMMGKMLAKRLPRLMKNPKIHSQNVKIGHKKQKDKTIYY